MWRIGGDQTNKLWTKSRVPSFNNLPELFHPTTEKLQEDQESSMLIPHSNNYDVNKVRSLFSTRVVVEILKSKLTLPNVLRDGYGQWKSKQISMLEAFTASYKVITNLAFRRAQILPIFLQFGSIYGG